MSLLKAVNQKFSSFAYSVKAKKYRYSEEWKNHPHNIELPHIDWNELQDQISVVCKKNNVDFTTFEINPTQYRSFKDFFSPPPLSLYAINCRDKKMMEHFIAYDLLNLGKGDRYLDVASENSPFPEMLRDRMGVEAYSLDLTYKNGLHGYQIGASAGKIPIEDNWLDYASLQCAFEHFQGEIDSQFIRELSRILRPGGKCVILPLYMSTELVNIYDPLLYKSWQKKHADDDATIIAEIELGGFYERFYDPNSLRRIFIPDIGLNYRLYRIQGKKEALDKHDENTYRTVDRIRYALEIEKRK